MSRAVQLSTLNTLKDFKLSKSQKGLFYSLSALEKSLGVKLSRLPVSIRIVLESVLRNCDGNKVTEEHVRQLANWKPNAPRTDEIPFVVSRILLQDFTGVPLLADLAAMRNVASRLGKNPKNIEPLVPVDLVVDHSVQIDHFREKNALDLNMKLEFSRNNERYQFMKWGMQAFDTFGVVPPGFGIVHQVNLEYLARGVHKQATQDGDVYYPDTMVGTDSHTTMINGLGAVAWGVGGIEAEAGMLGQPVYFLTPDVVGVNITGRLRGGCTATDVVLTVTEMLRKANVVGKFVEFFGEGAATLSLTDRATIANMAPEYGATMGFFPVDAVTVAYLENTGRTQEEVDAFEAYFKAQKMFGMPKAGDIDYSQTLTLDLGTVAPSLSGPRRPQDRIEIGKVKQNFAELFSKPAAQDGFNKKSEDLNAVYETDAGVKVKNGDVLIASITSCTNTSNPGVLLAAGLLAKKAVEAGLTVPPHIKTSLAPGSRVVTTYLEATGLLPYLEELGFGLTAYGCATCIGNSGDLTPGMNEAIAKNDIVAAAVLSGNRNFEARIHPNIRANYLASPPLVVAYAIAGTVCKDLMTEPIGTGKDGQDVWIGDIWPSDEEIAKLMKFAMNAKTFKDNYADVKAAPGKLWEDITGVAQGDVYNWPKSTYIAEPPFFADFTMAPKAATGNIYRARALGIFGDMITTDHISPAGSIGVNTPAGKWLLANGVQQADFNSYGARRGNHEVMMRGTFANVRIRNLMLPAKADGSRIEGGVTIHQPSGQQMSIYDTAMQYIAEREPTVIFGGEEYGAGSSRDWAAKGTQLLGVKAVIARSFERIHRANLVGMGVLPLQFTGNDSVQSLDITGEEWFSLTGLDGELKPMQPVMLTIARAKGAMQQVELLLRIDTPIEVDYYRHGGILPFVLRQLLAA
ncbi:MAG: aconitate hydratase AcnA [Oxalobacter sp.]|nr:MAG: aconitate hydratase AcnA [Oxalobacter sp.]